MLNLILLSIGTVVYYFVFTLLGWKPKKRKGKLLKLTAIFFLCVPFNFNGDVYTVLGNGESEKGFHSVFSFYQDAGKGDAITFISPLVVQNSEKGDATTILSVFAYQDAQVNAKLGIGSAIQFAKEGTAFCFAGIPFYQKSLEGDVECIVGISFYQSSKLKVSNFFGISFYQEATEAPALTWIGISFYQSSKVECKTPVALSFYKDVDGKEIWFNSFQ